jgi:hypothetical protein
MRHRALRRRYGHAGKRRSAASYAFLRAMPGWAITSENDKHLVAHKLPWAQGEVLGPSVEFVSVNGREWRAYHNGLAGLGTTPGAASARVGVPWNWRSA